MKNEFTNIFGVSFNSPRDLCVDATGNIYVAEPNNHQIRKITQAGVVTTFAGSGSEGSANSTGTAASFSYPNGLCADAASNIYVADYYNHKIRKITPAGVVTTFAGSGSQGSTNATGTAASFDRPSDLCVDVTGNIYVVDYYNHKIRKITPAGVVTTFAGSGSQGSTDATGTAASFSSPTSVCTDTTGNIYVADGVNRKIRKITQAGVVTTIAGSGSQGSTDGIGTVASFFYTPGLCADASGNIYVADFYNNRIRKIVEIVPSPPVVYLNLPASVCMGSTVDQPAITTGSSADFISNIAVLDITNPKAICKNDSFVFVLNSVDDGFGTILDTIRQYDFFGAPIRTYGLNDNNNQMIVADNANNIYAVHPDFSNPALSNIRRITPNGFSDFSFNIPSFILDKILAIELGSDGYLYASENTSGYIKKIDVNTAAVVNLPDPNPTFSFNTVVDIAFDKAGDMYVADIGNNKILKRNAADNNYYPAVLGLDTVEVSPTSALSNTFGTSSTLGDQKDGLVVKYFSPNNCSKMIEIADSLGGSEIGKVEVKETLSNLATFSSGKFVGRVTDVNVQNPNANARLKLFFTYQDIQNYNAANGAGIDLTNDTTGGTMPVAVLQLHKDSAGHIEQIQHNPITANWITAEHNWKVEFPITKFSTFYTGEATEMSTFTCADSTQSTLNVNTNFYVWHGDSLFSSGQYHYTLINQDGCDSVTTLNLTLLTTNMSKLSANAGISIYPNPNTGLFNVRVTNTIIEPTRIRVVNVLGTEVHNQLITGNTQINLSELNNGIYFVTIESREKSLIYRIVKQ